QWAEGGLKEWAESWGAEDILSAKAFKKSNNLNKIVKMALDDLTNSVNMSSGIRHQSDNDLCKTYLRALNKYGYELIEKDILSYLITEKKWDLEYANDIIKLVSKLNSGSYFIGGEKKGLKHYIKRWKML
ncbi:MAG: hypothetical protein WC212_04985, partial [Candidatus Delongbacteria bacterium]